MACQCKNYIPMKKKKKKKKKKKTREYIRKSRTEPSIAIVILSAISDNGLPRDR